MQTEPDWPNTKVQIQTMHRWLTTGLWPRLLGDICPRCLMVHYLPDITPSLYLRPQDPSS
jgi:hypothetical protein